MRRVIAYHGRCFDGAFSAALMNELSERLDGAATDVVYRPLAHQKGGGIDPAWLEGKTRIGVTAGASTPHWVFQAVVDRILRHGDSAEALRAQESALVEQQGVLKQQRTAVDEARSALRGDL